MEGRLPRLTGRICCLGLLLLLLLELWFTGMPYLSTVAVEELGEL